MFFVLRICREPVTVGLIYVAGAAILGLLCFKLCEFAASRVVENLRAPTLPGSRVASRVERHRPAWSLQAPTITGPIGPPVEATSEPLTSVASLVRQLDEAEAADLPATTVAPSRDLNPETSIDSRVSELVMRSVMTVIFASTLAAGSVGPAVAEGPSSAAREFSATAVADERSADLLAVIAEAETRMAAARDPVEKAFLSQIAGHYREPDARSHWVNDHSLSAKGVALREELSSSDAYGLAPLELDVPALPVDVSSPTKRAEAEVDLTVAAVRYAWHARGGRLNASQISAWLDAEPKSLYASDVFRAIAANGGDPIAGLRSFHPQHPQFERLRLAYLAERGKIVAVSAPAIPSGTPIEAGDRHPDVVLIRQRLGAASRAEGDANLLDRGLLRRIREVLGEEYSRTSRVDDEVRSALNATRPVDRAPNRALLDKYLVNLERWRTMPDDMGRLYIWNNLPEFTTRVVKEGAAIHEERIIIGKPDTQTPVFTDVMNHVIFAPEWGVPELIKLRQILPHMRGGDYGVLARRGMQICDGNRVINPTRIKWSKVDIRNVPIIQGPGPGNPLGRLKFMFPNHHDVYMHDTPDKHLFESSERTFSHGCIRVRNPETLAEVLLGETKGWSAADVGRQLKVRSTARFDLEQPIPVHNTYFTISVDPDGTVVQFADVYGHDQRYNEALAGKSIDMIAARDPALALKKKNDELRDLIAAISPKPRRKVASTQGAQINASSGWAPWKKTAGSSPPSIFLWFQ